MKPNRRTEKVVKITTFQTIKRGAWYLRFSTTDMDTIMLLCKSATEDTTFVKFFSKEEEAVSFVDFLVAQTDL